jgi:sec-independent protein translocase protein TatB
MIDFGFDKLALIGAVALIVIGPEKLPRVARTVGHLIGKAQRYVNDVKAEVNRSIELEELQKMKSQFESVAHETHQTFQSLSGAMAQGILEVTQDNPPPGPRYKHPGKNWRLKRSALPQWYKQRHGLRSRALSSAARVAKFRPPSSALTETFSQSHRSQ